jgi:16S rRNA (adenine1518-N6/adenine1519-N6)-dimethyltransferase
MLGRSLTARYFEHFGRGCDYPMPEDGYHAEDIRAIAERIAEEAGVDKTAAVLEIGPGIGALTQQLCLRAEKVLAIEVDNSLRPILARTLSEFDNLEIRFADAMKLDLAQLVAEQFSGLRPLACANLPYYITSPVLTKLLESRAFEAVTVMVQKEVAQRICAAPGSADYSAFSVFCRYYAEPEILFEVPPSCFLPQPKVTSAVLTLRVRTEPPCEIADEAMFFRVVRAAFAQRRKTLSNALAAGFPERTKAELMDCIVACGHAPTVRGETLSIPEFAALARAIAER